MQAASSREKEGISQEEEMPILGEGETLYGRRALNLELKKGRGLWARTLDKGTWMIHFTNRRIMGFRDEQSIGESTIPSLGHKHNLFGGDEEHSKRTINRFEVSRDDVLRCIRKRRGIIIVARWNAGEFTFEFKPRGAASRFFAPLLNEHQAKWHGFRGENVG